MASRDKVYMQAQGQGHGPQATGHLQRAQVQVQTGPMHVLVLVFFWFLVPLAIGFSKE